MNASTRVRLRVSPGAASSYVVGRHGAGWKIRVSAVPEGGKANDAVVHLLADALALQSADVAIVSGHASRDKTVSLAGIDPDETDRRLALASDARRKERA